MALVIIVIAIQSSTEVIPKHVFNLAFRHIELQV